MKKTILWMTVPFLFLLFVGLYLLLRPHQEVQVIEVVDNYTKQEKDGQRSSHKKTVYYAVVKVEIDGETTEVTVHENEWHPLQAGDYVTVTKGITGKYIEYKAGTAYGVVACAALTGLITIICIVFLWKRKRIRGSNLTLR